MRQTRWIVVYNDRDVREKSVLIYSMRCTSAHPGKPLFRGGEKFCGSERKSRRLLIAAVAYLVEEVVETDGKLFLSEEIYLNLSY